MNDQAERLRNIVKNKEKSNTETKINTRIITVTSGKGGVGKTNLTVNLALCLSMIGKKVLIIDADFGLANIDVMLGVVPKYDFTDLLDGSKELNDIISEGPNGISFISGGSGINELINLTPMQLEKILSGFESIDDNIDYILIDTGAGISDNIVRLVSAADEVVLVTTPEPTSIMDAYALVKVVASADSSVKINVVVNKAESEKEALNLIQNFSRITTNYLNLDITKLGYVLYDQAVMKSVKDQVPFIINYPHSSASKCIKNIVLKLEGNQYNTGIRSSIKDFFRKIIFKN